MFYRLFYFIILSSFVFISCDGSSDEQNNLPPKDPEFLYGFNIDSFNIEKKEVKNNQFFSDMLIPYNVSYATIDQIVNTSTNLYDVRKMRAGNNYTLFLSKDSVPTLQLMVYEIDKISYMIYDFRDSVKVNRVDKETQLVTQSVGGVINNSLYATMLNIGANPVLSNELANIYAWTIDFYRIQKGDKFKVVYEELMVENESIGIKRIKSAVFEHGGKEFYAIYFEQDGNGGYYDLESRGMKRPFLKAPVKYSRISSHFSNKRFHPVTKQWKAHLGTDYAAPQGTPIMTTANGVITHAEFNRNNGNYVKVKHNNTYTTQYLHMSKIKPGIRPGVRVMQGDIIGYVGSTGLATGPHVCYRFWKNGKQINGLNEKLPHSEPISNKNLAAFKKVRDEATKKLKKIKYNED
ncbi:MAG: hypothetical protein RLZZ414_124 [Bacteroidota bacterium]|jgi:murein DD-endopeptidase MepM/ murein hydrolase activator NlpD